MAGTSKDNSTGASWINLLGLLVLLVCYVGAIWNVVGTKRRESSREMIRLVHWQLETGVREGLQVMIDEFESHKAAEGRQIEVVQIAIPERVYNQYVTTQLIGGTAPDMIQIGRFSPEYLGRFFFPLSREIQRPNPFLDLHLDELEAKSGLTDEEEEELRTLRVLAGQPWMESFKDGLRSQLQPDFQEYFGVGFSTFTIRIYYNRDMFREVLGSDQAPATFEELIEICRKIEAYSRERNLNLVPIASSKYQVEVFRGRYLGQLTSDLYRELDLDLSGEVDWYEWEVAYLNGSFSPWNEQYRAATNVPLELAQYFPKGFMSLGREDSGFSFVQGKAAMITSGSWDALSYMKEIQNQPGENRFEVGIFDFPQISPDHPRYGRYAAGRNSEASSETGFAFGITRYTRNYDLCVEFLQFATTPRMNTRLNHIAGWIPSVRGGRPRDILRHFEPNFVGYFGATRIVVNGGGKSDLLEKQTFWPLVSGQIDYETYAETIWKNLPLAAATDYKRSYQGSRESLPNRELRRSGHLAHVTFGEGGEGGEGGTAGRTEREVQLLRSLQPLMSLLRTQPIVDFLMEKTLAEPPGTPRDEIYRATFLRALEREMTN